MAELSDKFEGDYRLFTYQDVSADELLKHDRYALWFEVGTGKTLIAVAALNRLPEGRVLILAPKRVLVGMWEKLDVPINHKSVTMLNYEKLSRMDTFPKADYVIIDEAQKIKASNTKIAKQIRGICKTAKRVYCLSGTPVGNSFLDVFNIFKNIGIKEFQYPESAFIARYYNTFTIPVRTKYGIKQIPQIVSVREQFKDELFETFGRYSNSLKMVDVHTLPEKKEIITYVEGMRSPEYELAEQGIIKVSEDNVSVVAKLEAVSKCQQAANGFLYYKNFETDKQHIKRLPYENYKLAKFKEIVAKHEKENLIVVYKFKADKMLLFRELEAMGRKPVEDFLDIDYGDTLLMQIGAGEGINAQNWCHTMIIYSYDYSHLAYAQTTGRIRRVGQMYEQTYYILVAKGTIEEKIYSAIVNKHSLDEFLKEATKLEV